LFFLVERGRGILADILAAQPGAITELRAFTAEIEMAKVLMGRLYRHAGQIREQLAIPWFVSGQVEEIRENTLLVSVESSNREDELVEIPGPGFPHENPRIGQRFFAKIDPAKPAELYDIQPLEYEESGFDEIFISIFGQEVFDRVAEARDQEAG